VDAVLDIFSRDDLFGCRLPPDVEVECFNLSVFLTNAASNLASNPMTLRSDFCLLAIELAAWGSAQNSLSVADSVEPAQHESCWIVNVGPFVCRKAAGKLKEQKRFFVREGPKTSDLDKKCTWRHIKNKWG